jgi:hypothetical protein
MEASAPGWNIGMARGLVVPGTFIWLKDTGQWSNMAG